MNIFEMNDEDLNKLARRFDIDAPKTAGRKELEDLVQVAMQKHQMALEAKAKSERTKELETLLKIDPTTKAKPSPETILIGESSKIYVVFLNLEEEGVDVAFNWGCTHTFHLWHDYVHVMPKCVIDRLRDVKDPTGKRPIYGRRPHPTVPELECDMVIGHRKRFNFEVLDEAPPKNASFGVVLNRKIYDKLGVPFPLPVVQAGT